ncbi:site-2 protease family protein [Clavibacter michiganensis]|uniref:site-2 protease family protein n=1 Tax=Clavibacter michiganensis TaxID=28447 RepID=UPI00311DC720
MLIIVVGVAVSIGLHEVGHLVPAKLFGVRVTQYMIGFGPTVFSRRKGETEYGVKAIPLGGYISMIGMFPPQSSRAGTSSTGIAQLVGPDTRRDAADAGSPTAPDADDRAGRGSSTSSCRTPARPAPRASATRRTAPSTSCPSRSAW